jgi:hypothetical protein
MLNNYVNFGFSIMKNVLDLAHKNLVNILRWTWNWDRYGQLCTKITKNHSFCQADFKNDMEKAYESLSQASSGDFSRNRNIRINISRPADSTITSLASENEYIFYSRMQCNPVNLHPLF